MSRVHNQPFNVLLLDIATYKQMPPLALMFGWYIFVLNAHLGGCKASGKRVKRIISAHNKIQATSEDVTLTLKG